MDFICGIPPELEEVLANTLQKVSCRADFGKLNLEDTINTVCRIVELDPKFLDCTQNPLWIDSFRERWAHKLLKFEERPLYIPVSDDLDSITFMTKCSVGNAAEALVFSGWCDSDVSDPVILRRVWQEASRCKDDADSKKFYSDNQMRQNFSRVSTGELKLENICLACGTVKGIVAKHPLFIGGLCKEHRLLMYERFFKYDTDGYHSYCSVCYMGRRVVLCDMSDCRRCYCRECMESLISPHCFDNAVSSERWACSFCDGSGHGLLQKRVNWQEEIQRMHQSAPESKFMPFFVPSPIPSHERNAIRVLSLFDGIATGIVALKQLGLEVGRFVASEINEDAVRLVQNKHPEVIQVGDITKLTDTDILNMGPFDLLLGGSPCNDLSGANPRRKGLLDAEGSGCLFFDFFRVLKLIEPPKTTNTQSSRPFFWLFENVASMKGIEKQRISRFLQCEPRMADARYVSAASRPRLFWGNIPGLLDRKITPGLDNRLTVQDCLEPGRKAAVEKLNTITTKFTCLYQGQARQAPVTHDGKRDILWTTEVERIFGVPEHYTDVNNLGPRERLALLGRSWSVPVVRILLSPLKEYFRGTQPRLLNAKAPIPWWN